MIKEINDMIDEVLQKKDNVIIAVDGRCGAGKTTLAELLKFSLGCNVIHMDDFFLRKEQRTDERLKTPGENIDHERFLEEVLKPLKKGEDFSYSPFDCALQSFGEPIEVKRADVTVIEGTYACHKELFDYYDYHIFVNVSKKKQLERILKREGNEKLKEFKRKWIPLEEMYFKEFNIKEKCELVIKL